MISDSHTLDGPDSETALPPVEVRRRLRNIGLVGAVIVLHGVVLALLIRSPRQMQRVSDTAPAARGAVSVTLVSQPAKPAIPAPSAPQPVPPPVARAPEKAPQREAKVLATEHYARRAVTKPTPVPAIPKPEPATAHALATSPAPPATTSAMARPSSASNVPPAPPMPIPKGVPDAPAAMALPKAIGANQMGKLGCRIPAPEYPAKSRRLGQEGTVALMVTIGIDGRVSRVRVQQSSGYPALDDAAVRAVQAGQCQPYRDDGRPAIVETLQPIAFHLND